MWHLLGPNARQLADSLSDALGTGHPSQTMTSQTYARCVSSIPVRWLDNKMTFGGPTTSNGKPS